MDPFIKHGNERGSGNSMNTRSMNKAVGLGGEGRREKFEADCAWIVVR